MIKPLIQGLALTLKYFFTKKVTMRYPEEKWEVAKRWRGRHFLPVFEASGKTRCVACMLCASVCPAECIHIVATVEPDNRRHPATYTIDLGRCIFCGYCVEVCPKQAIEMTTAYEISQFSRADLILNKEALIEPPRERYEAKKRVSA